MHCVWCSSPHVALNFLTCLLSLLSSERDPDDSIRALKKEEGNLLNESQRSEVITIGTLQRKESSQVQGMSCSHVSLVVVEKQRLCVCLWESMKKKRCMWLSDEAGLGPGRAGRRQTRERDIYLELQSARLLGGVRYCSRVWQGQEGTRVGDTRGGGWGAGTQAALGVVGLYPHGGPVGGWRVRIGRFLWAADAQYADV